MNKNARTHGMQALTTSLSPFALETFVGIVLAFWILGRIIFVHSVIGETAWANSVKPYSFVLAIVVGSFIAALACKGLDFELPGIVGLCCLLFAVFTIWSRTGDAEPIVLALLLVTAKGMNLARLLRYFWIAVLAALAASMLAVAIFSTMGKLDSIDYQFPLTDAFSEPGVIVYLLFGALCAAFLSMEKSPRLQVALTVACLLCAVAAFSVFHAKRCGMLMLFLAVCIMADGRFHNQLNALFSKSYVSWFIAALPIALLCLSNDAFSFYAIGKQTSGFAVAVPNYGYSIVACFALLYVRSILLGCNSVQRFSFSAVFILYAIYLLFDQSPLNLEFNCALLLLSAGFERNVLSRQNAHYPEAK